MKNKNKDQVQCLGDQIEELQTMKEEVEKLTRDFWEYAEDTNKKICGNKCCKKK